MIAMTSRGLRDAASGLTSFDDPQFIERLRAGDEAAFMALVEALQSSLTRVARQYVRDPDLAGEVVQETWLAVLRGLDRFEGRSSLRTWIFRILMNRARTRGAREARSVALSSLADADRAVSPERFLEHGPRAGHWASRPASWEGLPEKTFLARETLALVQEAIDALAPNQRAVIILRDIEGWTPLEICNILELSETNQRVLLHRARSNVRRALEQHLSETGGGDV